MGWSLRVLRRRAAAQRTLLATVLAVALIGASLLGTFALLLFSSEHHALDTALAQAPVASTDIDVDLTIDRTDPATALASGEAFLDELLGDVPSARTQWLTSPMHRLPETGGAIAPLAYLASYPAVASHATLVTGQWPTTASDDRGRVAVTVPEVAADRYGWTVGTELPVTNLGTTTPVDLVVVGVHELTGPSAMWTRDLLDGLEHDPSYPLPGSFGFIRTDAWGPFVVAPEALAAAGSVASATLVAAPELADSPAGAVEALRGRFDDAQPTLLAATDGDVVSATLSSRLATTIDVAQSDLAVTRVSLVIVGLMLMVLAVTVLLLAARLLADRRAPEQTLMSSRGASGRQLLGLAALEAACVAVVTTAVSPWVATLLFQAITSAGTLERAGLNHDPRRPASLWITCAVSSFVLAAVLLAPLLRRRGSVADAEQRLVRQDRRGGLARSGADLALLAVAGVAIWQLTTYQSPVTESGASTLDPVLVAAPALLLLAGAVLALRLLPLVTGAGERLASRSRSLVSPLAAWEVGRRPARAAGAVLLLTLAIAVGSFSQSFLSTWRTSQTDQVDLAVGTDVRIDHMSGTPSAQSAVVRALPGVQAASAVVFRSVDLGEPTDGLVTPQRRSATLLALDTTQADALLRGRIAPDWGTIAAPLQTTEPDHAIPLPADSTHLRLDMVSDFSSTLPGTLLVTVVVEDPSGTRTSLTLPASPLAGVHDDVEIALPADSPDLRLVGVVAQAFANDADPAEYFNAGGAGSLRLDVAVLDVRAVERPDGAQTETVTPVPLVGPTWTVLGRLDPAGGRPLLAGEADADGLRVTGAVDAFALMFGSAGFAATTFAAPGTIPVVATDTLLTQFAASVGDTLEMDIGGALVPVTIVREVPYLPGQPRGVGILADRDLLSRAVLLYSGTGALLDEWWLAVPDDSAAAVVDDIREADAGVTESRATARHAATDGPLRVGVQAALWIVTVAAVALAVAGFAMSATVAVRTRRLELARLQALGAARSGLVRSVLVEHGILGVLGLLAGLALGAVLGRVVAPLVTLAGDGGRPVPAVLVQWPWPTQVALVTVLALLVGGAVALTTSSLLRRASGELLRLGDER